MSRADSVSAGYFSPSRVGLTPGQRPLSSLIGSGGPASVARVTPASFQGAAQPQTISVLLNGPVNSVTVRGFGAISCTGTYGTLIGYDKNGVVLGSVALALMDPADCGGDDITYGAAATLTVTQGVIVRFDIAPMSPFVFQVAGRASAEYFVNLGVYPASDYPPIPAFTSSCNAATFDCTFDATASTDDFGIASSAWNVGKKPEVIASGSIVTASYGQAGWRTVTLGVTDNAGQRSLLTKDVGVGVGLPPGQSPTMNLVITCTGLTCTFNDHVMAATPNVYRTWNLSDGTYLNNVAVPTHTFAAPGTYSVDEKVADQTGVYSFAYGYVIVNSPNTDAPPTANFTWTCAGQPNPHQCAFDASSSSDDVGIVSYKWDWGDGRSETRTGPIARNTWAGATSVLVTLTVTDTKGQTNSFPRFVLVP